MSGEYFFNPGHVKMLENDGVQGVEPVQLEDDQLSGKLSHEKLKSEALESNKKAVAIVTALKEEITTRNSVISTGLETSRKFLEHAQNDRMAGNEEAAQAKEATAAQRRERALGHAENIIPYLQQSDRAIDLFSTFDLQKNQDLAHQLEGLKAKTADTRKMLAELGFNF